MGALGGGESPKGTLHTTLGGRSALVSGHSLWGVGCCLVGGLSVGIYATPKRGRHPPDAPSEARGEFRVKSFVQGNGNYLVCDNKCHKSIINKQGLRNKQITEYKTKRM